MSKTYNSPPIEAVIAITALIFYRQSRTKNLKAGRIAFARAERIIRDLHKDFEILSVIEEERK